MRDSLKIALGIIIGVIGTLVLCILCSFLVVIQGSTLLELIMSDTESVDDLLSAIKGTTTVLPEEVIPPFTIGESVIHNNYVVTVDAYEFLDEYAHEYRGKTEPPEGAKFAWVHISIKNVGENAIDGPYASRFKLVYRGERISSSWGGREGFPDYRGGEVFPEVMNEGWLGYVVPITTEAVDLEIIFEPDASTDYIWKLGQ
jgi:hypothetical protein